MVDEEQLFSRSVHRLQIINATMSNHGFETITRISHQPEYGITTIARTDSPDSILVDIWLGNQLVGRRQNIFHRLSAPVTADLIVPLTSKPR